MTDSSKDTPSKTLSPFQVDIMIAVRHIEMVVDVVYAMDIQFNVEGDIGSHVPALMRLHLNDALKVLYSTSASLDAENLPF